VELGSFLVVLQREMSQSFMLRGILIISLEFIAHQIPLNINDWLLSGSSQPERIQVQPGAPCCFFVSKHVLSTVLQSSLHCLKCAPVLLVYAATWDKLLVTVLPKEKQQLYSCGWLPFTLQIVLHCRKKSYLYHLYHFKIIS
jgi:hypothetical protein